MQGIVGLVTRMPRQRAERQLQCMVETLRHESFYEIGTWIDEPIGVYVGWSARRGPFSDRMPLRNERGDVTLVFSGEEFGEPGISRRLKERGHDLALDGPDYLVHLCEDDPTFPAGLNGRFHGLAADRTQGAATLFNDRYGLHRLYYHAAKDGVYFAGEAKAILAVRPELRTIDPRALGEYVSCRCVLENRTLFSGLHVLPGASRWTLRDGAIERQTAYFRAAEWEQQPILDQPSYYGELRDVVARTLPRYFAGPEPIGISLTGGFDSRIIMARRPRGAALRCYTFAGMFRESHDVRVARQVAEACGLPHRIIRVDDAFLARFPTYAERTVYLSDGCADVSRSPDLYINAIAREIAPVRLTGNFGGEVLRRVVAFKPFASLPSLFVAELRRQVRQAEATYAELRRSHPLSFAVFQQAPWHHHGLLALEESQLTQRSPYLDNDLVRTAFRAPESAFAATASLRLIAEADPGLLRIPTDLGIRAGGVSDWPRRLLRGAQFKAEYKGDDGMPQWLAGIDRRLSSLHPERLVLGRHKFLHFRVWYRDVLADHVRSVLLDPRTLALPFVEPKAVEAVVRDHIAGQRNYTVEIHRLLTIELIHRLFIRGDPGAPGDMTAAEPQSGDGA